MSPSTFTLTVEGRPLAVGIAAQLAARRISFQMAVQIEEKDVYYDFTVHFRYKSSLEKVANNP